MDKEVSQKSYLQELDWIIYSALLIQGLIKRGAPLNVRAVCSAVAGR